MIFREGAAAAGHIDGALAVLEDSAAAYEKLGLADRAAEVRELQKSLREKSD